LENHKAILLNVPLGLLEGLNEASAAMSISRTELIRRCLSRDLKFVFRFELSHLADANSATAQDYFRWVANIVQSEGVYSVEE
jgi:hypothetical protein